MHTFGLTKDKLIVSLLKLLQVFLKLEESKIWINHSPMVICESHGVLPTLIRDQSIISSTKDFPFLPDLPFSSLVLLRLHGLNVVLNVFACIYSYFYG